MANQDVPAEPFMEHPTGQFPSAVDAIADAIARLRALATWDRWIAFGAQGCGETPDSYAFAEIRMCRDVLEIDGEPLDVPSILEAAGADEKSLTGSGPQYSVAGAAPEQAAHIFNAIYRHCFGIQPFADEGDDYAVGAEWLD